MIDPELGIDIEVLEGVGANQEAREIIRDATAYLPYKTMLQILKDKLGIKDDRELLNAYAVPDDLPILLIGNHAIRADAFRLRPQDRYPVGRLRNPGKSCNVAHTDSLAVACLTMMGRAAKREDCLYRIQQAELRKINFEARTAPIFKANHLLHTRIIFRGSLDDTGDIPAASREALANLLNDGKHKVPQNSRQGIRR